MAAKTVKADYMEQVLPEYNGNPLIEALPDIMSAEETLSCLTRTPAYNQGERNLEAKYRIHCLSRLLHDYYQPLAQHLDIENRISVCLRQGYRNRNPLERQYALMVNESYEAMLEKRDVRPVPGYHPNASGFTIIGVSGVGKSTAVESILSLYPQVIEHTEYKGMPLAATQIVWLKLDCPHDGSRGELCYRFFKAVDDAVGSEFFDQYKRSRITIDSMLTLMQRIAQEYSLGLLVVDEVQHLSLAKGGSDAMLNFFVTLVNTIGVPVILIGTSKAMPILQGQFRQARRSSGHGDLIWNRMKKERNWITFVESIWKYQWIREDVPLTAQMLDAVYEETQGIIVLAVVLYVLLQEDAIRSERETFDVEDIRRVARERMALVQPMLKALRDDNKKEIDRYEDITEILVGEVTSEIRDGQPSAVKQPAARAFERVRDEVLEYFVKMRKQPEKVEEFIGQAYRESASCDFAVIAERVYELVKQDEALAKEAVRKAETEKTSMHGETCWRRLPQMPGAVWCPAHGVALRESGTRVQDINYQLIPATYALMHVCDPEQETGTVYAERYLGLSRDIAWLLKNGDSIPDGEWMARNYLQTTGRSINTYLLHDISGSSSRGNRFEDYLANRIMKDIGKDSIDAPVSRQIGSILSIEKAFGSMEKFCER